MREKIESAFMPQFLHFSRKETPAPKSDEYILIVSRNSLYPSLNGFTLRASELLRQIAQQWRVALIAPTGPSGSPQDELLSWHERVVVPRQLDEIRCVESSEEHLLKAAAACLTELQPLAVLCWLCDHVSPERLRILNPLADPIPPVIFDMVDSWSLHAWRRLVQSRRLLPAARAFRDLLQAARGERQRVREVDATCVVGEQDAHWLTCTSGLRKRIYVNSNGVSWQPERQPSDLHERPSIVFSGVMEYPPNIEAAIFFCDKVFPHIRNHLPQVEFIIAGRKPARTICSLASRPGVIVEADVPDMSAVLRKAWVAVCPMRSGAGVKNKVLEAWACGLPVVMTPISANGLHLAAEMQPLVHGRPRQMADCLIQLLSSRERVLHLGAQAQAHVRAHHSWEQMGAQLCGIIRSLTTAERS